MTLKVDTVLGITLLPLKLDTFVRKIVSIELDFDDDGEWKMVFYLAQRGERADEWIPTTARLFFFERSDLFVFSSNELGFECEIDLLDRCYGCNDVICKTCGTIFENVYKRGGDREGMEDEDSLGDVERYSSRDVAECDACLQKEVPA